jgi:hypothetical protein
MKLLPLDVIILGIGPMFYDVLIFYCIAWFFFFHNDWCFRGFKCDVLLEGVGKVEKEVSEKELENKVIKVKVEKNNMKVKPKKQELKMQAFHVKTTKSIV